MTWAAWKEFRFIHEFRTKRGKTESSKQRTFERQIPYLALPLEDVWWLYTVWLISTKNHSFVPYLLAPLSVLQQWLAQILHNDIFCQKLNTSSNIMYLKISVPLKIRKLITHRMKAHEYKISTNEHVDFLLQIARGMSHLHSLDPPIIHGDLACRNVLMCRHPADNTRQSFFLRYTLIAIKIDKKLTLSATLAEFQHASIIKRVIYFKLLKINT